MMSCWIRLSIRGMAFGSNFMIVHLTRLEFDQNRGSEKCIKLTRILHHSVRSTRSRVSKFRCHLKRSNHDWSLIGLFGIEKIFKTLKLWAIFEITKSRQFNYFRFSQIIAQFAGLNEQYQMTRWVPAGYPAQGQNVERRERSKSVHIEKSRLSWTSKAPFLKERGKRKVNDSEPFETVCLIVCLAINGLTQSAMRPRHEVDFQRWYYKKIQMRLLNAFKYFQIVNQSSGLDGMGRTRLDTDSIYWEDCDVLQLSHSKKKVDCNSQFSPKTVITLSK